MMKKLLVLVCIIAVTACRDHAETRASGPAGGASPARSSVNIYAYTGANALSPEAARARPLVYVPNSRSGTVSVIDPGTYQVIRTFATGKLPQHVVPSYDLKTLWVANNRGGTLTPIDPTTGLDGKPVIVDDPYNLYFTPDGKYAMVIAEARRHIDFRDPQTMKLELTLPIACKGLDHVEFTADGRYAIATCEFSGQVVKIDLVARKVVGYMTLDPKSWINFIPPPIVRLLKGKKAPRTTGFAALMRVPSMPQDIRSSADGSKFYVADMKKNGVYVVDPVKFERVDFIHTGIGTHGIFPSRDGRYLYVTNRRAGSVTVIDFATHHKVVTWHIAGGGSPDMGGVSPDGKVLWLAGRYSSAVYALSTKDGHLIARIPVGLQPHGLCVWPQPGRYSLGHTGVTR